MAGMTWRHLFGLIHALNQISSRSCLPAKRNSTITESGIYNNLELLAMQHRVDYLSNEVQTWKDTHRKRKKSDRFQEESSLMRFMLEKIHYEAYKHDKEKFIIWPEAHFNPERVCAHFLQQIVKNKEELSRVTGKMQKMVLYYTNIHDAVDNCMIEPLILNGIQCQLPKLMKRYRFINLVRSPSYPDCTFLLTRLQNMHHKYNISEEICESTNFVSIHRIVSNAAIHEFRNQRVGTDTIENKEKFESLHLHYYSKQQNDCEQWPELEKINKKYMCLVFLSRMYPRLTQKCIVEAEAKPLQLKYFIKEVFRNVKALICIVPIKQPPNHFHFIRTPKSNCVYLVRSFNRYRQCYFIAKELCVKELLSTNQTGMEFKMDDADLLNKYLIDDKLM